MITSLLLRMEKAMKCGNVFELVLLWHALYEHTLAKEKHFKMSLNNRQTHRAAPVAANWSFFYGCYHSPWLNAFAHWLATPYLSENINSTVLSSVFFIFLLSFLFFIRNALIAASLASWYFFFLTVSTFCWFQWSEFWLALKDPSWTAWEGFFFLLVCCSECLCGGVSMSQAIVMLACGCECASDYLFEVL